MNEQKSLFHKLAEVYDQHRAERRAASAEAAAPQTKRPGRGRALLRWLTPNGGTLLLVALLILTQNVWARRPAAPTTATSAVATTVNYQGHLADSNGNPLNDTVSLTFAIYDAETGGNVIWGPEMHAAVDVQDGLFSVGLGTIQPLSADVWAGGDRYLEIAVNGQTLSPREPIRAVPFAQMAWTVPDGSIATDKIADGAVTNTQVVIVGPGNEQISTTSTSFEDIPGFEIVMETTGGPVLLSFQGTIKTAAENGRVHLDFTVDGVSVSQGDFGIAQIVNSRSGTVEPATTVWVITPTAGAHTFRVQWKLYSGDTAVLNVNEYAAQFAAVEFKR